MATIPVIVVLDACVLYPASLRDFLLCLAEQGCFRPGWSADIVEEFVRNILADRPDLERRQLHRTVQAMNAAFPEACVTGYDPIVKALALPDPGDRHVLAAAIKARASVIVTLNLRDFPLAELAKYGTVAMHPDAFVVDLMKADSSAVERAFRVQLKSLKNPPVTVEDLLATLERRGMVEMAGLLRARLAETPTLKRPGHGPRRSR